MAAALVALVAAAPESMNGVQEYGAAAGFVVFVPTGDRR